MTSSTRRARIVLLCGQWFLIAGLIFFSLMTSTPLVDAHNQWKGYGWVLGLMTDAAFIMALQAESTLARFSVKAGGPWPAIFRWTTGIATVFLNTWHSISERDYVGVAIHLITPALVLILAEVGPVFMRHLVEAEKSMLSEKQEEHSEKAPAPAFIPTIVEPATLPVNAFLPADEEDDIPATAGRKSKREAASIIEQGWRHNVPIGEVAEAATRHPVSVRRQYAALDAQHHTPVYA